MNWATAGVVRAFLPLALVVGAVLASPSARRGKKAPRRLAVGAAAGLAAAAALHLLAGSGRQLAAARLVLDSAVALAAALYAVFLLAVDERSGKTARRARPAAAVAFVATLAAASLFGLLDLFRAQALSATSVVNTELIVNVGGLLVAALLTALLIPLTARVAARVEGPRARLLAALSAFVVVQRSAQVLLGLMRLELLEKASWLLSLVARVDLLAAVLPFVQVLMLAGLSAAFFRRRAVFTADELSRLQGAAGRKAVTGMRSDARWSKTAAAACGALLLLLSFDVYASRPPRLTRALRLTAAPDGYVRVKLDAVDDGSLHRFSFETAGGEVVRFLLVRVGERAGRSRIVSVYDACMMCGDKGYVERKGGVFCLACNVRIFTPSIGKPGGCNPIPLEHRLEGGFIVIAGDELGRGAGYFTH